MRLPHWLLILTLFIPPVLAAARGALAEDAPSEAGTCAVVGIVREGSKPVAATVTLRRLYDTAPDFVPSPESMYVPALRSGALLWSAGGLEVPPPGALAPRSVKAGADGRFRFGGLASSSYRLEAVTATGGVGSTLASVPVDGTVLAYDIEIGKPTRRTVSGRARYRDGRPFRGRVVPVENRMVTVISSRGTQVDAEGRFQLTVEDLGASNQWPLIGAVIPRRLTVAWPAPEGGQPLELVVDEEARPLHGLVVGARTGKPIAGAWVFAMSTENKRPGTLHYAHARSDAKGRFHIPHAPAAAGGILVVGPEHGHALVEFKQGWPSSVRVPLKLGARVRGELSRSGGGRASAADVGVYAWIAHPDSLPSIMAAEVHDDGRYDFGRLPPGRSMVYAVGRDVISAGLAEYVLGRDGALPWTTTNPAGDLRLDLPLVPCGRVAGVVVDAAGKPIAGAFVRAFISHDAGVNIGTRPPLAEDNRFQRAASAADGTFSLGGLVPGIPYRVMVRRAGYAEAESRVLRPVSGQVKILKLVLPAADEASSAR